MIRKRDTMTDEQILKEINPVFLTARSSIYRFALWGDETAKKIVAFLEKDGPKELFRNVPDKITDPARLVLLSMLEARYRTMGEILNKENPGVLLDIPCGYTMRPIEFAGKGIRYFGADLPATIADMTGAVDAILSESDKKYVHMVSADATNPESVEEALAGVEDEVCITTEGLLSYFTDSEMDAIFETMRLVMKKRGGCWLTPDREFGDYMQIAARVVANGDDEILERFNMYRAEIAKRAQSSLGKNAFMSGTLDESIQYANRKGFHVERINIGRYLPDLKSFEGIRDGLMDELREACINLSVWKLTLEDKSNEERKSVGFQIDTYTEGDTLVMEVSGRLDTLTAPELVARFGEAGKVRIDFSGLDYISSAGLRSLMIILKKVGRENMSVVNLKENVREIFETTGFDELML